MKEFQLYIDTLIKIAEINYGSRSCLSYDNGRWYSRDHSGYITAEEACEYILKIIYDYETMAESLQEYENS